MAEELAETKVEGFVTETPEVVVNTSEAQVETPAQVTKTPEQELFETQWKTYFPDEDVETVKSYKTKVNEYEAKVKEYEPKVAEYENKVKELTEKRFANERIAKINELAEAGIEVDENLVAFLNKDYNKITEPLKGLAEDLRNQHPDWSEKKVQFELKQKYKGNEITPQLDGEGNPLELTPEQMEIKEIVDEDIARDWANAKKALIEKQDKTRIVRTPTAEDVAKAQKAKEDGIKAWNERFEKVKSDSNLKYEFEKGKGIKINDVDVDLQPFEFTLDKEDLQKAHELFNTNSPTSENSFFQKLIEYNGGAKSVDEADKIVMNAILTMIANKKSAQKLAVANFEKGYELAMKQDKNASTPIGKGTPNGGGSIKEGFWVGK